MWVDVEIVATAGKGRAVRSTACIRSGATILESETPMLILPSSTSESYLCDVIERDEVLSNALDAPEVPAVLQRDPRPSLRRLYTNAFLHVSPSSGVEYVALYQRMSLVNHSCVPNAILRSAFSMNGGGEAVTSSLVAARDIRQGDEVCIAYQLMMAPRCIRRAFFEQHYGFTCDCARCTECGATGEDVDDLSMQVPGIGVNGTAEESVSPTGRRLEKMFQFSLDPIRSQTMLRASEQRLDALRNMLRLSLADDVWHVFEATGSTYWKAAMLREAILINAHDVLNDLNAEVSASVMQRIRTAQTWFVMWFFTPWVSPEHVSHLLEAIR